MELSGTYFRADLHKIGQIIFDAYQNKRGQQLEIPNTSSFSTPCSFLVWNHMAGRPGPDWACIKCLPTSLIFPSSPPQAKAFRIGPVAMATLAFAPDCNAPQLTLRIVSHQCTQFRRWDG